MGAPRQDPARQLRVRLVTSGSGNVMHTQGARRLTVFEQYRALSPGARERVKALIASLRRLERTAR